MNQRQTARFQFNPKGRIFRELYTFANARRFATEFEIEVHVPAYPIVHNIIRCDCSKGYLPTREGQHEINKRLVAFGAKPVPAGRVLCQCYGKLNGSPY